MTHHIGGFAATTADALAESLIYAAEHERGHCDTNMLDEVCALVLRKIRASCPCGFGTDAWHQRGVCAEGAASLERRPR